jgi:hypothetical protein
MFFHSPYAFLSLSLSVLYAQFVLDRLTSELAGSMSRVKYGPRDVVTAGHPVKSPVHIVRAATLGWGTFSAAEGWGGERDG